MTDEARFDAERNITTLGGRRIVFHCHHYNVFLQRTIDEALGAEAIEIQRRAAKESARMMLGDLFAKDGGAKFSDRIERASKIFGALGFGLADVSGLSVSGGVVKLVTSHYAIGWQAKFGASESPVCHFAVGFWAGAVVEAAGLAPERVIGAERRCASVSGEGCELSVEVL
jgi:predicted hydrocarbon binding protein